MEKRYCVFLRGINVNGISIKMDALKEAFIRMGFPDAKTILATGNVIITFAEGARGGPETQSYLEKELGEYFHYEAHVILRSYKQIEDVALAASTMTVPEGCHHYYLLCDDQALLSELKDLFHAMPHSEHEQFMPLESGAFWIVPKGATLSSEFGAKILGNKKYKNRLTSRNMNTIEKIYQAMMR